jgi:L-malate glycosyltransferase
MRILCVNYEYPPVGGGGATMCKGLSEALVRLGHEVTVVTSGMPDLPDFEKVNGVQVHRVPCRRPHRHYVGAVDLVTQVLPTVRKAVDLIRETPFDINHTHFVVPSGVASHLIRRETGLPFVITAHGSDVPGYNPDRFGLLHRLIGPLWTRVLRASSAVTAPSCFLKDLIQARMDIPVDVIPNGFDPVPHAPVEREKRILVVTRMFERKGVQFLIKALQRIQSDWEVCVAGDGPYLPRLREQAARAELPIRFLGMVPREEITRLYLSSRIFVFPSLVENFPMVLLEAMAAGCAVITTGNPGCAEVVGDAALKVAPGRVAPLREALVTLLENPAEIERLGAAGRERVTRFAWPRVAGEFEAVFRRCRDGG